ncbi:MAG: alpha-L-fucosidase [Schleiferilactobacillus harbinensis]|jgi:hypothetical protein|nr:alpha-L-fucosidase [Schleiferilactobacillus harbinensis]
MTSHIPYRQIHLDFHTPALGSPIATDFDPQEFTKTLLAAGVDSITLFAKDHHGYAFYDTDAANHHPDLHINLLSQQVDAAHEAGIKAPIYLSVGFDEFIGNQHPEWFQRNQDGEVLQGQASVIKPLDPGFKRLCLNSPYVDYLKAQIIDVIQHFESRLDGLFFDIIRQSPCYCHTCMVKMNAAGIDATDPQQVQHYADEVTVHFENDLSAFIRAQVPDCPIFYNAGSINPTIRKTLKDNSHLEIEALASSLWGYGYFPATVRYAKNLGMDYLGMTSKFHFGWADFGSYKNPAALEYEVFLILAHGGKVSIGDQMYPNGRLQPHTYDLIGNVFNQIKPLEAYLDDTRSLTDIAIVYPDRQVGEKIPAALAGAVAMLNEAHLSFDVVDAVMDWSRYRLIVLPDGVTPTEQLVDRVNAFTAAGGKVLSSFHAGFAQNQFAFKNFPVQFVQHNPYKTNYWIRNGEDFEQVLYRSGMNTTLTEGAKSLALIYEPWFNRTYQHFYSHMQAPFHQKTDYPAIAQNDTFVFFAHPIFTLYNATANHNYKVAVIDAIQSLLNADTIIQSNLPSTADVVLNEQPDQQRYVLHLLHYVQQHRSKYSDIIEDKLPLVDIDFSLHLPKEIKRIERVSDHQEIPFTVENGRVKFSLDRHIGHDMFVLETV